MLGKIEMRPGLVKKSQGWYSGGGCLVQVSYRTWDS